MGETAENEVIEQPTEAIEGEAPEVQAAPEGFDVVLEGTDAMPASDSVPLRKYVDQKRKWKEKAAEASKSADAIRAENELLKMQLAQHQQPRESVPQMPTLEGCNYDEDEFRRQSLEYAKSVSVAEARKAAQEAIAAASQSATVQYQHETEEAALTRHYEAAQKLGAADYEAVEDKAIELFGRDTVKAIITNTDDSHTLLYWLGKNPDKAMPYVDMIQRQPAKGVFELGKLSAKIKLQPRSKTTPAPDEPISGADGSGSVGGWQAKLDKARQKGDLNETMRIRREAKAAGHNIR